MYASPYQEDFQALWTSLLSDDALHQSACLDNEWFTPAFVRKSVSSIGPWFASESLSEFERRYPQAPGQALRVGLIMAGNLPLVGFHDLLMVLLGGHRAVVKPSHKDRVLTSAVIRQLPTKLRENVQVKDELHPNDIDFLVATGSNNTARQLAFLFQDVPKILRGNRYSVALAQGDESREAWKALAGDILDYHGMGCRSISNLIVPPHFDPTPLVRALEAYPDSHLAAPWERIVKWENAMAEMNGEGFARCDRIVLLEADDLAPARIGTLRIITSTSDQASHMLEAAAGDLQCVAGTASGIPWGHAQRPGLFDFADGVDVLKEIAIAQS